MDDIASLRVAFVGAGNMASSLIQGLLADGARAENIALADPFAAAREKFTAMGMAASEDNNVAVQGADAVILAVKPQMAGEVVEALDLKSGQVLVSIAAGIDLSSLTVWSSAEQPIVRCMPNTPALLGAGMTGLYANANCSETQRNLAQRVLAAAGATLWVSNEAQLDAVTAVSGSGPAYFFLLMESMIDAGVTLGLDRSVAEQLTIQTAYGAALMARDGTDAPAVLRKNVTSPGGTTAAALQVMSEAEMPAIISAALIAADQRAAELAREFGATPSQPE